MPRLRIETSALNGDPVPPTVAGAASGHGSAAPPRETALILHVLEALLGVLGRPATASDVALALTTPDRAALGLPARDRDPGAQLVAARLDALVRAGEIRKVGGPLEDRYTIFGGAAPAAIARELTLSRRRVTLMLVGRAVVALERAVRQRDVVDYAAAHHADLIAQVELTPEYIARNLSNLTTTGELLVVGTVRGMKADGTNLYLPATLADEVEGYRLREPLTWLDYVLAVFMGVWSERVENAARVGGKPRPITTAEIRAALFADVDEEAQDIASARWGHDLGDPMVCTTALRGLASGTPAVRQIPGRAAVWVPVGVKEDDVAIGEAFATDADRLVEATRRAMVRHGRLAVTRGDVEEEITLDPALALAGTASVAKTLADLAKTRIDMGGRRAARRTQRLHRVGLLGTHAAYYAPPIPVRDGAQADGDLQREVAAAARYVTQGVTLRTIADARLDDRVTAIEAERCHALALGRARLVVSEIDDVTDVVRELAAAGVEEAMPLVGQLFRLHGRAMEWEAFHLRHVPEAPVGVEQAPLGFTPMAMQAIFGRLDSTAARLTTVAKVVRQYGRLIRRIPNPEFTDQRSGDAATSLRFLFDRTDALLYAARQWGGPRVATVALTVEQSLGELRDAGYAIAALRSPALESRLAAVGALAFLQSPAAVPELRERALADSEPGVRVAALWALGFMGVAGTEAMLEEAKTADESAHVRREAQRFLSMGPGWSWAA